MQTRQLRTRPSREVDLGYLVAEPAASEGAPWPVVLFLHGAGERGTDLDLVTLHGLPKLVADGQDFPFLLVAPQCRSDSWWTWQLEELLLLLDDLADRYPIDPARQYVTGLSMGGIGTWELAARAPDRFAAVVPICGAGQPWLAPRLREVSVWAFHNVADAAVPADRTRDMIRAIRDAGGVASATIYDSAGHDAWTAAYGEPELIPWLLRQRKPAQRQGRQS